MNALSPGAESGGPDPARFLSPSAEAIAEPLELRLDESVLDFWRRRIAQHLTEYYAGVRLSKFPEDLRVLEQLLFAQRPDAVIEIGCQFASSSLWIADRLASIRRYGGPVDPLVVALDIDTEAAHVALDAVDPAWRQRIVLIEADITDPSLPDRVDDALGGRRNCMVIEDSAHTYETTIAALSGFARFVAPGGYLVVEDGVVDVEDLRLLPDWPRGVHRAIDEFLSGDRGREFVRRADLEPYGLTSHPGGYLQRRA
ncbi:MAG TPA: CmcI family methyltransferase [Microthrixaceae bacterium]|nr:CmcI family methyltransferase [Microthrixaceae bacterium]